MSFRIRGLSPETFAPFFDLSDGERAARTIQTLIADEPHSAPCRVSLKDAEPGADRTTGSGAHQARRPSG